MAHINNLLLKVNLNIKMGICGRNLQSTSRLGQPRLVLAQYHRFLFVDSLFSFSEELRATHQKVLAEMYYDESAFSPLIIQR